MKHGIKLLTCALYCWTAFVCVYMVALSINPLAILSNIGAL